MAEAGGRARAVSTSTGAEVHGREAWHLPTVSRMQEALEVDGGCQPVDGQQSTSSQKRCCSSPNYFKGDIKHFSKGRQLPQQPRRLHGLGRARRGRLINQIRLLQRLICIAATLAVAVPYSWTVDVIIAGGLGNRFPTLKEDLDQRSMSCTLMPSPRECPKADTKALLIVADRPSEELSRLVTWLLKKERVTAAGFLVAREELSVLPPVSADLLRSMFRNKVSNSHLWFSTHDLWKPLSSGIPRDHDLDDSGLELQGILLSILQSGKMLFNPYYDQQHPTPHQVLWLDVVKDKEQWLPLLIELRDILRDRAQQVWDPPTTHPLRARILNLVPWKLTRLQIVKTPKQRRFPLDVTWSQRGCALLHVDDSVSVETEDIHDTAFPRLKFQKPVALGVFFYGRAPESPEQFQPEQQPQFSSTESKAPYQPSRPLERHLVRSREGITFAVDSSLVPPEMCHAVSRMHVTLGHPSNADLVRLLSHQGASLPAITAARALRCEFCLRHRAPRVHDHHLQLPLPSRVSSMIACRWTSSMFTTCPINNT